MTISLKLKRKLPNHNIFIDSATYPGSMKITIDNVAFPLFPKTNDIDAVWQTLQTYCFSFSDSLCGANENVIDNVINDIISDDTSLHHTHSTVSSLRP